MSNSYYKTNMMAPSLAAHQRMSYRCPPLAVHRYSARIPHGPHRACPSPATGTARHRHVHPTHEEHVAVLRLHCYSHRRPTPSCSLRAAALARTITLAIVRARSTRTLSLCRCIRAACRAPSCCIVALVRRMCALKRSYEPHVTPHHCSPPRFLAYSLSLSCCLMR